MRLTDILCNHFLSCFQLQDIETLIFQPGVYPSVTVSQFLQTYFGFEPSFVGFVVLILLGFSLLFFGTFAIALQKVNFQKR